MINLILVLVTLAVVVLVVGIRAKKRESNSTQSTLPTVIGRDESKHDAL